MKSLISDRRAKRESGEGYYVFLLLAFVAMIALVVYVGVTLVDNRGRLDVEQDVRAAVTQTVDSLNRELYSQGEEVEVTDALLESYIVKVDGAQITAQKVGPDQWMVRGAIHDGGTERYRYQYSSSGGGAFTEDGASVR